MTALNTHKEDISPCILFSFDQCPIGFHNRADVTELKSLTEKEIGVLLQWITKSVFIFFFERVPLGNINISSGLDSPESIYMIC